jgi:hypothetical protein
MYSRDPAALKAFEAMKGGVGRVKLQTSDIFYNYVKTGGDGVHIKAFTLPVTSNTCINYTGSQSLHRVIDQNDGTYILEYNAPLYDSFHLCVLFKGSVITGMPKLIIGLESPDIPPSAKYAMIALATLTIVAIIVAIVIIALNRNAAAIRSSSPTFLFLMLVGCVIMVSSIYPLAHVNNSACMMFPMLFSTGFMLVS